MVKLKEMGYFFKKVYLYRPGTTRGGPDNVAGAVNIELSGNKGQLKFCLQEACNKLLQATVPYKLGFMLYDEASANVLNIHRVRPTQLDKLTSGWDFNIVGFAGEGVVNRLRTYRFVVSEVMESQGGDQEDCTICLEGIAQFPFEVRDNRVIGFKKEERDTRGNWVDYKKNPLFSRVEPFQPPIPNTVWWQISMQPYYNNGYQQVDFCPRQKSRQVVF